MTSVELSLNSCAEALGGYPERFFVDEVNSVYRIVEHATGRVVGILKSDGTFGNFKIEPDPGAPPVVATLHGESGPASAS